MTDPYQIAYILATAQHESTSFRTLHEYVTVVGLDETVIADLIQQRQAAQQQCDFATADQIRDRLAAVGVTVVDRLDSKVRWHCQ